jgi:hypothetical protein
MTVQREGGCACGAVRYRVSSDPLITHCCHCLNCQRQTGSAFVINLLIEDDRVDLLAGDPQPIDVPRDDGSTQRIFRSPRTRRPSTASTRVRQCSSFAAAPLDEPSSIEPDVHIFTKSKLPAWRFPSRRRRSRSSTTSRPCGRRKASSAQGAQGEERFGMMRPNDARVAHSPEARADPGRVGRCSRRRDRSPLVDRPACPRPGSGWSERGADDPAL